MRRKIMGYIFGLDIGVASVGVAVINNQTLEIEEVVSDLFESADASKNVERRSARQSRRLQRRRKNRVSDFNRLWIKSGYDIPEDNDENILLLRNEGIKKALSEKELYYVLRYMLQHRGISYLEDALGEEEVKGSYQKGIALNQKESENLLPCEIQQERMIRYGQYRGQYEITEEDGSKVTLSNIFTTSSYIKELNKLFEVQQKHGLVNEEFVNQYMEIFRRKRKYYEGPGNELSRTDYGKYTTKKNDDGKYITEKNIFEKLIGKCSVYKNEFRAAGASYTAQEFNILNDLNNITVDGKKLSKEQKVSIIESIKSANRVSVEKIIGDCIGNKKPFIEGARIDKNGKHIYHSFEQYNKMRKAFELINFDIAELSVDELDEIGRILTINTEKEGIEEAFKESKVSLTEEQINALIDLRRKNSLAFNKWQSLSVRAMRELIPDLYERSVNQMVLLTEKGIFKEKENEFAKSVYIPKEIIISEIYNPVVKRSVSVALDALNALIKKYGYPDDVVVEMPRDKNEDEQKDRIKKFQKNRENELKEIKNKLKQEYNIELTDEYFRKHKGLELQLKLWVEQEEKCPYSGKYININDLLYHHDMFEVDHIIPLSISYDDGRNNKVLVYREENQSKRNNTPMVYLANVNRDYDVHEFMDYVLKNKKFPPKKKSNLLYGEDITKIDVVKGFINRNLNDTRYASRSILNAIQLYFSSRDCNTTVRVINGTVTHQLRNRLKLEKDRDKSYSHHAIDAAIICYTQLGLLKFKEIQSKFIDFDNEVYKEADIQSCYDEKYYDEALFSQVLKIRNNLKNAEGDPQTTVVSRGIYAESEKNNGIVKYHHRVDKKANRGLSNATIYGTRNINNKIYKIVSYDIRDNKDVDSIRKIIAGGKQEYFLMYKNDPKTFEMLMSIYEQFNDEKNPFVAFEQETGEKIRKYSKKHNGPVIKKIKYADSEVGSCIDISANYGYNKDDKKVIMDTLKPYRADLYYNRRNNNYRIIGVKYADFKFVKGRYILDEASYEDILVKEEILKPGMKITDLESEGYEFRLSFYKNDIIQYEKDGDVYKERFLSRTMPKQKNYIETKPIVAAAYEKRIPIGLTKAKNIGKIYTDILGNEKIVYKERFKLSID